jgi:hypothetical protein
VTRYSKKKTTQRGSNKQPAAAPKAGPTANERSLAPAQSIVAEPKASEAQPTAHTLDALSESLKSGSGFYFAPTSGGVDGIHNHAKVKSIEPGHSAEGPLLKLTGGDLKAISAGTTEGFYVRVPDTFERDASERIVRVRVLARSDKAPPTRLVIAYSTKRGRELRLAVA